MRNRILSVLSFSTILFLLNSCSEEETDINQDLKEAEEDQVGFELVELASPGEILIWKNNSPINQQEFDSLQIGSNWLKNQPRESEADGGGFRRSPDAENEGEFTEEELFGYNWIFNAEIVEQNVPLPENDEGLLAGRLISKYHWIQYNSGRKIYVLISPNGEEYIRVTRDANRETDSIVIPDSWSVEERTIDAPLSFDLPNPTLNIRIENNQDSYQGPVNL